jgi:fructan beta-fructosidase
VWNSRRSPRTSRRFNPFALALAAALIATPVARAADDPHYYDEPFRPQFHFTPERNWMNDPNGCVFFDGEWHLFYQYNPAGDTWGHMSWGHAVSPDLLRWKHLPVALPEENGVMIFSGSAVVDHRNTSGFGKDGNPPLVAIYTGHGHGRQTQNIAHSTDRGRTWTKFEGNPVIDIQSPEFRDPKVMWYEPTKRWVMVVARPDAREVLFYGSPDLKKWEQLGEFGGQGAVEGIWECPDLFELPVYKVNDKTGQSRWVLVVNINGGTPAGGSGCQYFVGRFDGKTFVNDNPKETVLWADYGADFYAAQSWSDVPEKDGRRIWIAWMSNWRYAGQEPTKPFRTAMTIPREVRLTETRQGLRIAQRPVRELTSMHAPGIIDDKPFGFAILNDVTVGPEQDPLKDYVASRGLAGDAMEIIAVFVNVDAEEFGFKLRTGKRQETVVGYDATKKEVFVDRTRSGHNFHNDFPARHAAKLEPGANGSVNLRVFLDRSSVEVLAGSGLVSISDRVFPDASSLGLSAYTKGGTVKAPMLFVHKLKSAWR